MWGDEQVEWQKKESFAAMMSKKAETKPPVFDDTAAINRKAKELFGEGYQPNKAPLMPREKAKPGITNVLDKDH